MDEHRIDRGTLLQGDVGAEPFKKGREIGGPAMDIGTGSGCKDRAGQGHAGHKTQCWGGDQAHALGIRCVG